jgi:hypothetical protein
VATPSRLRPPADYLRPIFGSDVGPYVCYELPESRGARRWPTVQTLPHPPKRHLHTLHTHTHSRALRLGGDTRLNMHVVVAQTRTRATERVGSYEQGLLCAPQHQTTQTQRVQHLAAPCNARHRKISSIQTCGHRSERSGGARR